MQFKDSVAVWERIAPSYAASRRKPWPQVEAFIAKLPTGGLFLDLGCGGGRHSAPLARAGRAIAVDSARAMLHEARTAAGRGGVSPHLVQASATALPFKFDLFDGVIFIAALHNIPGRFERRKALDELALVMRPGSEALVTVWLRPASVRNEATEDATGQSPLVGEAGDAMAPWNHDGRREERFYHFYSVAELDEDLRSVGLRALEVREETIASEDASDNLFVRVAKAEV
ncbi:MAG: class I SAM-dependent methyltransferase [Euryarchaeota archaeon]|nr:class I SAM-dependent methyltransferase [Euryarchaeota archaeon]